MIDKPRHIRKYPLKLPTTYDTGNKVVNNGAEVQKPVNIYQNAVPSSMIKEYINKKPDNQRMLIAGDEGRDVFDGFEKPKVDMNPFTNSAGPSSANPFSCYLTPLDDEALAQESEGHRQGEQYFEEGSLVNGMIFMFYFI